MTLWFLHVYIMYRVHVMWLYTVRASGVVSSWLAIDTFNTHLEAKVVEVIMR